MTKKNFCYRFIHKEMTVNEAFVNQFAPNIKFNYARPDRVHLWGCNPRPFCVDGAENPCWIRSYFFLTFGRDSV